MSGGARAVLAFVRLSRLKFLAGGVLGVALGTVVAAYESGTGVRWGAWALAQLGVSAFQLMTHYANDYFDREADAHAQRTPFSGGSGALVDGSLPAAAGMVAALVCAACGVGAALALAGAGRAGGAIALLACGALAWMYSAPPARLLARGLGELDTALVVAVAVPLAAFEAQGGAQVGTLLAVALPGACAMFAMMLGVEAPDAAVDAAFGKRNLLVRRGKKIVRRWGPAAIAAAFACVLAALAAGAPRSFAVLQLLSIPPGIALGRAFARSDERLDPYADAELAARGVVFFFVVAFDGVAGYAAALVRFA